MSVASEVHTSLRSMGFVQLFLAIVFLTERIRVPAPGLGGGGTGACGEVLINGVAVDSRRPQVLSPGDEVILRTPGGGGYGAAEERSDALRSYDRLHGYTDV